MFVQSKDLNIIPTLIQFLFPLPDLITQQILNCMRSIVYDNAPVSLEEEFPINQLNREYQLRNNEDFLIT